MDSLAFSNPAPLRKPIPRQEKQIKKGSVRLKQTWHLTEQGGGEKTKRLRVFCWQEQSHSESGYISREQERK